MNQVYAQPILVTLVRCFMMFFEVIIGTFQRRSKLQNPALFSLLSDRKTVNQAYVFSSVSTDAELNSSGQKSSSGDHSQRMPSTSGSNHQVSGPLSQQQPDSNDIFYLSSLIARRARTLLVGYELRQLFVMASHIGFNLTSWLKRERSVQLSRIWSYISY